MNESDILHAPGWQRSRGAASGIYHWFQEAAEKSLCGLWWRDYAAYVPGDGQVRKCQLCEHWLAEEQAGGRSG